MENFKDYKTNIKEIVFSNEEEKSFCDIFVYEPENIEEKLLGNLYIIGEVVNLPENSSYIVNLLASIIKKEFYSNKKRSTLESLEASLNKANSTLSEITERGNVAWIGNLNMTCAAHRHRELHLSQTGKIKTLLARNGQIKDIGKNINSEEKPHPFRTFANIASGELEINDLVLFATPGLFDILSMEKIRQLSYSADFEEITNDIQEAVSRENNLNTIAALLVNMESKKEEAKIPQVKILEDEPSRNLWQEQNEKDREIETMPDETAKMNSYERSENETGSEGEKISLENIIKEFEEKENVPREYETNETEYAKEEILRRPDAEPEEIPARKIEYPNDEKENAEYMQEMIERNEQAEKKTKSGTNSFESISRIAGGLVSNAKNGLLGVLSAMKIRKPQIDLTQKLRLMRNSKIIISIFALLFIVLLGNAVITNYNNQIEAEKKKYSDLLDQSQAKIDEAEQVLIYNDSVQARQKLTEAQTMALEVRDGYKSLSGNAETILAKIQIEIDKIDKVFRIDNPAVAMDLSKNEKISNISTLTKFNGNYYTLNPENSVFSLDLSAGISNEINISIRNTGDANQAKRATTMTKTGEIIFLSENNRVLSFDSKKNELKLKSTEPNAADSKIVAISSYNSFIYLLEPGANQIYKYKETADGFRSGTKWINEKTEADIRSATSMTIDSTIFVLKSNGQVEEYLTGNKVKFSVEELKDPAQDPSLIFTETGLKNLYIADPSKNRIIVYGKDKGELVGQFIVKNFNNTIKDITVGDKEEAIYVLSNKNIFKLDLAMSK